MSDGLHRGLGFAVRLAAATSLLVLLACIVLAWLLVRRDLAESRRQLVVRGRSVAESLAREAELAVLSNDAATMRQLCRTARVERDVLYCRFFDRSGTMLADVGERDGFVAVPPRPDVGVGGPFALDGRLWEFRVPVYTEEYDGQKGELALLGEKAGAATRHVQVGTVTVGLSLEPLLAHRNELVATAAAVAGAVILVGILGAGLLATAITRPLKALVRATRALAAGELDATVSASGYDEVGELARSFNTMVQSLAQSRAALEDYSRTLEDKVQARTERLEAVNRELAEANRLKSEFLATISHELRTPLNVILGYAQMLDEGAAGPVTPMQSELLTAITRYSEVQLDLVTNVLDFSRLTTGRVSVHVQPVQVTRLLEDVCALHRGRFAKPGVALVCELSPELPEMRTDGIKLQEIVRNLVDNAFKFTDTGTIAVRAEPLDGDALVRIAVEDTGAGIDPAELPYVFDEFRQIGNSATRRTGGVGLGLSIVKRLVDVLGGTIRVASQPGIGSTFEVEVPTRWSAPPSASSEDAA